MPHGLCVREREREGEGKRERERENGGNTEQNGCATRRAVICDDGHRVCI